MGDKAQLIICAAREAFLEKGYDGVSMDKVASRAGVAKQTVYARYTSKDALFLAVVESLRAGCFPPCPRRGRCQFAIGCNKSRVNCSISFSILQVSHCPELP